MPEYFACPYLGAEVELTDERRAYLERKHPETLVGDWIASTLEEPDLVRTDRRMPGTRLFSRWYDEFGRGRHVVVVVVSEAEPVRHWTVTSYVSDGCENEMPNGVEDDL